MSNLLEKQVKVVYTLDPGYTVRRWHPAVTTTTYVPPVIWGWDPYLPDTKVYASNPESIPSNQRTFSHWGSIREPILEEIVAAGSGSYLSGPYGWRQIDIVRSTNDTGYYVTNTVAGYYSYDAIPGSITTTYDPNLGWTSAARSIPNLVGDGQATFSVPISDIGAVVGLNQLVTSGGFDYFEITHGIYLSKGNCYACERGVLKTPVQSYTGTDVFTITRKGATVYYAKNNVVFYQSLTPLNGQVVLDCSLYSAGDQIVNAALAVTSTVDPYGYLSGSFQSMGVLGTGHAGVASAVEYAMVATNMSSMTASATITVAEEGVSGSIPGLTVLGTSGWEYYNEISESLSAMTVAAFGEEITPPAPTYMTAGMLPMYVDGYATTGGNTLPSVMAMVPMDALGTAHAGAASALTWAEATGSFQSMVAEAGEFPSYDAYLFAPWISLDLKATGFSQDANQLDAVLFTMSLAAAGGANAAGGLFSLALSSTGTLLETGAAALPLFTSTLSSTGTTAYNGAAGLGLFTSTITAYGGATAALTAPLFTASATGTNPPTGEADLPLWEFSFTSTGTKAQTGIADLPFITFELSYAAFSGVWPLFSLSSAGSDAVSNSVAYVMNVHTQESTKYSNFGFLHIVHIGGKPYGVKSDGLYLLEGTTDNGVAINGTATSKETDFGTFQSKHAPTIYMNSDTTTTITPIVDSVTYPAYQSSFAGRKTVIARGIAGRYWRFKIDGIQQLEGIEYLPEHRQKRVK